MWAMITAIVEASLWAAGGYTLANVVDWVKEKWFPEKKLPPVTPYEPITADVAVTLGKPLRIFLLILCFGVGIVFVKFIMRKLRINNFFKK